MNISKNTIIGLLIVALLVLGGILLWNVGKPGGNGETATSTATSTGSQNGGNGGETRTPAAPVVTTTTGALVSNSTAAVNGRVTPNGAQTTYWYEYGSTTALGTRTTPQALGSGFSAITAPVFITGLSPNTTYYFRLSARNAYGTVNGDTFTFTTNSTPPPQGNAPTTRSSAATSVSRTTANLNGTVNPNSSSTSYWFEYGETTNLGNTTAFQGAGSGSAVSNVSVSVSSLKPLTKYYFRLNAQNQFGTVNGSIESFTTTGPAAPGQPSADTTPASGIATSSVTLTGRVNPNGASTTYWFEYGTDSLLGNLIGSGTAHQAVGSGTATVDASAEIRGLAQNTRYYYRVVAQNSYGTIRGDIQNFRTRQ